MPVVVSVDLGTTKITGLAVDVDSGGVLAVGTTANDARVPLAVLWLPVFFDRTGRGQASA